MGRSRLTITLRDDIIKQVDRVIDGAEIRNRSHAIEYMLQKSFSGGINRALILAGGSGQKLRPITYEMPKAMLPVAGKPILEHIINQCRNYNIRDIIISIGPHGEKIRDYFGDGTRFGVRISYVVQTGEVGTAQAVLQAKSEIGS